jgi:ParB/RepB/Spo0J family partition protein
MNSVHPEFATVNMDLIEISDRARTEFGDVRELAASIKTAGLIQPLAVCRQSGDKPYRLIAGERRYRAKKLNEDTTTPVRIYPEGLTPLQLKTIELHENFYRKDFTWLEQIKLQKEIHELQQAIHGIKISTLPDAPGWSMADTAELVNRSKGSVSMDIQLANAVEQFPELFADCKTKSDASKILGKVAESVVRQELAKRVASESRGSDVLRRLSNSYVVSDFFEVAKGLEGGIFNFIEIDPPYAIDLNELKKQNEVSSVSYELEDYHEIEPEQYHNFLPRLLKEAYRLAADHAWMIVWFAPEPWFEQVYNWIREAGWETTRMVGIWTKGHGQTMNPDCRLANSYEMFFYARKGAPVLASPGAVNDFRFSPVAPQKKIHPTQRPVDLMEAIYSTFAFEGSRVLIPCAGSGSGIIAADKCRMSAVATDINGAYKDSYLIMLDEYLNNKS